VSEVLRARPAAAFLGFGFSKFNDARNNDPDFRHCRAVPLGERAIGFFRDDLLRVLFRKEARRDGFEGEALDVEAERRLIERLAREEIVAEAKTRLETKTRNERHAAARAAREAVA
jgi:hypothetical protein